MTIFAALRRPLCGDVWIDAEERRQRWISGDNSTSSNG
jgi:hypothetical protein